jgi:PAS domain S-box-containing protein
MKSNPTCEQILNASNNAVIGTDSAGKISFMNARAQKIFKPIKGMGIGAFISDVLPISSPMILKCLESGQPQLGQQIICQRLKLVFDITPVKQNDQIIGTMCSFKKMQQFEMVVQQLDSYKKLNQQLQTIYNTSSDGIWVFNGAGQVIAVNKAGEKLDGVKAEDVIGRSVFDLINEGIFDGAVVTEVLKTKRKVTNLSDSFRTNKTNLCTGTPVMDERGDIFLVIINQRDMTELTTLRDQLEETRLMAEKIRDELSEMSLHELRADEIIVKSEEYKQVLRIALKLAHAEASNILILGESGTGKGLLAKFIHNKSKRKNRPFIQISCAAIPENLLEAELFGYEKGAFTGAWERGKAGIFELAHEGTLFLDEIGDLPFAIQAKLLKYLDDNQILRLGGTKPQKMDCSIIAATNRNLEKLCQQKEFREDLFFRLNAFTLRIPPLRKRPEDAFELTNYFLNKYNNKYNKNRSITPLALERFQYCTFPGNVREIKNIVKKAVVLSDSNILDSYILQESGPKLESDERLPLKEQLANLEKEILSSAMLRYKTTRIMAGHLGINQSSVVRKLKKHGLTLPSTH